MILEILLAAASNDILSHKPKVEITVPSVRQVYDPDTPTVSMVVKRPLYREIYLKCPNKQNDKYLAIMSYSEVSGKFCTPKHKCHFDILAAAQESCR
ncbi:MAG: hypothetical protein AAF217_10080 [Pseudomonadota bacterium]